jgi:CRISPR-associated protein Cas8a1/Csx13
MAQIGEKARRERSSFQDQVNREFTRLRVAFSRSKNAASLREVVTDFWARGGPTKPLQTGWRDVLGLLDEKNWRKAKDLALLALASYRPETKDEAEALETSEANDKEGEE